MLQSIASARAVPVRDDVTELLAAARTGERAALDRLFEKVYDELHALAHCQLGGNGSGHTLGATALVHEAYVKLVDGSRARFQDRHHFFAVSARAMRQIIVDWARRARAQKRGGGMVRVVVDAGDVASAGGRGEVADLVALDHALAALERVSPRLARIVELRFFAGLSVDETGAALALSPRTVKRDWQKARAFLLLEMQDDVAR